MMRRISGRVVWSRIKGWDPEAYDRLVPVKPEMARPVGMAHVSGALIRAQDVEMCEFCGDAVDEHDMRKLDGCRGCTTCIREGRPLCDICDRPADCPIDGCTFAAGDWNAESGNHFSCEVAA